MVSTNDPWIATCGSEINNDNLFDDNFVLSCDHGTLPAGLSFDSKPKICNSNVVPTQRFLSNAEYSKILEAKLNRLQNKEERNGKTMLENIKAAKDFYFSQLLCGQDIDNVNATLEQTSFLNRLYNTNGVYRHLNPQHPLDSTEKEPLVSLDYLSLKTNDNGKPME